eukprot:m.158231 g.158231  ORF g.158231 m.158231 type:complete len:943 (-) comp15131_c1_seq2:157-2985(-)
MMIAPRMVLVVVAAVVVKAQNDIDVFKNEADLKISASILEKSGVLNTLNGVPHLFIVPVDTAYSGDDSFDSDYRSKALFTSLIGVCSEDGCPTSKDEFLEDQQITSLDKSYRYKASKNADQSGILFDPLETNSSSMESTADPILFGNGSVIFKVTSIYIRRCLRIKPYAEDLYGALAADCEESFTEFNRFFSEEMLNELVSNKTTNYTLLAPTNTALQFVNAKDDLYGILARHIIVGEYDFDDLEIGKNYMTVDGTTLQFQASGVGKRFIDAETGNSTHIVTSSQPFYASNGIILSVYDVLSPIPTTTTTSSVTTTLCPENEKFWRCYDGSKCIRRLLLCDDYDDCPDKSDELPSVCLSTSSSSTTTSQSSVTTSSVSSSTISTSTVTTSSMTSTITTISTTTLTSSSSTGTRTLARCTEGEYFRFNQNDCQPCPAGSFQSNKNHNIRRCQPWKDCKPTEHQVTPGSPTSNPVCARTTECDVDEWEKTPKTASSDRECEDLQDCPSGTYVSTQPSETRDRECSACKVRARPPAFGYSNTTNQASCTPFTAFCTVDEYVSTPRNNTHDLVCSSCPPGQFQNRPRHILRTCVKTTTTGTSTTGTSTSISSSTVSSTSSSTSTASSSTISTTTSSTSTSSTSVSTTTKTMTSMTSTVTLTTLTSSTSSLTTQTTSTSTVSSITQTKTSYTGSTKTDTMTSTTSVSDTTVTATSVTDTTVTNTETTTTTKTTTTMTSTTSTASSNTIHVSTKTLTSATETVVTDVMQSTESAAKTTAHVDDFKTTTPESQDSTQTNGKGDVSTSTKAFVYVTDASGERRTDEDGNYITQIPGAEGSKSEDHTATIIIVVATLLILLLIIGVVVYKKLNNNRTGGKGTDVVSFDNPLYETNKPKTNAPEKAAQKGATKQVVAPDGAQGDVDTGYIDIKPKTTEVDSEEPSIMNASYA